MILGHELFGQGAENVLVLHDWTSSCTSYDAMRPYLDTDAFTYAFTDLRGYGKSKEMSGEFSFAEAVADVKETLEKLGWDKFHLVGHSMTGLVVQKLAKDLNMQVKSVVSLSGTPACGYGKDDENIYHFLKAAAFDNDEFAKQAVGMMTGNRLSQRFLDIKVSHWRQDAKPEAAAAYVDLFCVNNIVDQIEGLETPILAWGGENDGEFHQEQGLKDTFLKWYPKAEMLVCKNSGHYPMQEAPIFTATEIERFMKQHA